MRERSFIIEGYLGYPTDAWLPCLKAMLEKLGYRSGCRPCHIRTDRSFRSGLTS